MAEDSEAKAASRSALQAKAQAENEDGHRRAMEEIAKQRAAWDAEEATKRAALQKDRERSAKALKDTQARIASHPRYVTTQTLQTLNARRVVRTVPMAQPPGRPEDWKLHSKNTTILNGSVLHDWTWERVEIPLTSMFL